MSELGVQYDLWGNERPNFVSAKERYGTWPVTVWDVDYTDRFTRTLKAEIADDGSARDGSFGGSGCYDISASIFSPAVAAWALNCWAPDQGVCFDPFAGGGTRAIMAAAHGLTYTGTELREEEASAVRRRAAHAGYADKITILTGDARYADEHVPYGSADFVLTCPPYWTLERYEGGPEDLSGCATADEFEEGIYCVADAAANIAKPDTYAAWIIGLHRGPDGELEPLHHRIAAAHRRAGWQLHEEVILNLKNTGAIQRIGNFEKGSKRLIRTHEYLLVFRNQRRQP